MAKLPEDPCSIARTLGVVGERWTILILREAFFGASRFAEFRDRLGVAPDVLSDRLATLVEFGVMSREPYREPGARSRFAYRLTPAGHELRVVLSALQQWGTSTCPGPRARPCSAGSAAPTARSGWATWTSRATRSSRPTSPSSPREPMPGTRRLSRSFVSSGPYEGPN